MEKVLIVGSGLVGSSVVAFLSSFGVTDLTLSEETSNVKEYKSLFDVSTLSSFSGSGGLGNFWHNVLDLGAIDAEYKQEDLLNICKLISNMAPNHFLPFHEVIPYTPIRPKNVLSKLKKSLKFLPRCTLLAKGTGSVIAHFDGGIQENFDRVFVCNGAMSSANVLIESGLAERNDTVSDHIIFYENRVRSESHESQKYLKTIRGYGYFSRPYETLGNAKLTYRPVYWGAQSRALKNRSIYNNSKYKIIIKLLNPLNFTQLFESIYLRYGLLLPTKKYRRFAQVAVDDCYYWQNDQLLVDEKKIQSAVSSLNAQGLDISNFSGISGIHFYNTVKNLDNDIGNFNDNESAAIQLLAPSYRFEPGPHHFSFKLLVDSYHLLKKIYSV